jgi:DNA repair protein RecN (Recombination protein N)
MLTELYIRNLTLIEELSLIVGPGLTVLTGETGAGKSILLDAIFLVIGGRASSDQIRDGAGELDVSARFFLDEKVRLRTNETLHTLELHSLEESSLLLRRVVSRNGRHRQYINGAPVTVSQLREVAEPLIDFTGQHAQHALLAQKGQLSVIDAFASHEELLEQMAQSFDARKKLLLQKQKLNLDVRARTNRIDWLRFQIDEIEKCAPSPGELASLVQERERLQNSAKIREEGARVLRALQDGDDGDDVASRLVAASRSTQALKRFNPTFENLDKQLSEATAIIDDVCREVARYLRSADEDPSRLGVVEDRIGDIKQILRKHGDDVEEVLKSLDTMRSELSALEDSEVHLEEIEKRLKAAESLVLKNAKELSTSRALAAAKLAPLVKKEISDLGMPAAVFSAEVIPNQNIDHVTQLGCDHVRMLFGANPGESANALEKVASGGELSRVMLAIKRVLMTKDTTMVSIFDEVDAGVGGAIGHAIGEKLKAISNGRQVLCVTHLAQVAALADAHMKVEKGVREGRTTSKLQTLSKAQRIDELARMMGGKEVTELTRRHASEFLEQAGVC